MNLRSTIWQLFFFANSTTSFGVMLILLLPVPPKPRLRPAAASGEPGPPLIGGA